MYAEATSPAGELLALWESAAGAGSAGRDEALLACRRDPPPASLGARNAALMALRARLFGSMQPLRCNCVACGATTEFAIDCGQLAPALLPAPEALSPQRLEAGGYRIAFRLPDAVDLRHAAAAEDSGAFARTLLERCVSRCTRDDGTACAADALPADVADALSARMEELEPGASVEFALACPECDARWTAAMDVGDVLWSEVQARAERLLLDVDALARAYGWSEAEILALSPTRRAAYLQLAGAA